jgi:hypothetical protein
MKILGLIPPKKMPGGSMEEASRAKYGANND